MHLKSLRREFNNIPCIHFTRLKAFFQGLVGARRLHYSRVFHHCQIGCFKEFFLSIDTDTCFSDGGSRGPAVTCDSPSSALYSLPVQSWPGIRHSTLYLMMGTPPRDSGSSNSTTAVLENVCTSEISGEDGTSATDQKSKNQTVRRRSLQNKVFWLSN